MRIYIYHYQTFLQGSYAYSDLLPKTKLREICEKWKTYFGYDINIWKFKNGRWALPHNNKDFYFDKDITLQEYVNFYRGMNENVYIIFI